MVKASRNKFEPDYVTPPGETLLETINTLGMKEVELAKRTGKTPKTINEIIRGKAPITPETAIQLERAVGIAASFWNNRQRRYDEFLAGITEQRKLEEQKKWVDNFSYSRMSDFGWIEKTRNKVEKLNRLLEFFGFSSPGTFESYFNDVQIQFRKSEKLDLDKYALAAWLRQGEIMARNIECLPYNRVNFQTALEEIRALTVRPVEEYAKELVKICAFCGVAVVFVRELPKTASGATRWLNPNKALIQLSLKYKTDDHLWFTFFHEAAHIILHQKKKIFLEGGELVGQEEKEADNFAAEMLIPAKSLEDFIENETLSTSGIRKFAKALGIAPGIVVGRLQHKGALPWQSNLNHLKRKLRWAE